LKKKDETGIDPLEHAHGVLNVEQEKDEYQVWKEKGGYAQELWDEEHAKRMSVTEVAKSRRNSQGTLREELEAMHKKNKQGGFVSDKTYN
jgi:hypothetical protein